MKRFSIAAKLPVNVLVEARTKKEAIEKARKAELLAYEPAGDIQFEDAPAIVKV